MGQYNTIQYDTIQSDQREWGGGAYYFAMMVTKDR